MNNLNVSRISSIRLFRSLFLLNWILTAAAFLSVQTVSGQSAAQLTHNTAAHFQKGMLNHTAVSGNTVQAPFKVTGMSTVWTATASLPRKVQHHGVSVWNNYMYVTGGLDVTAVVQGNETRRITSEVYRGTISNGVGSYSDLSDLPVGVMHHASLVANGHLYVIGGILDDSTVSNRIYHAKIRADGSLSAWVLNPDTLPVRLWGHTADCINGFIIITGGNTTTDTTSVNQAFTSRIEPNGNISNIQVLPPMPMKRNQHASAVFGDKLYLLGGFDENGLITTSVVYGVVDLYGGVTGWQTASSLPEPLYGLTATADHGTLIVSGGYNDNLGFSVQYSYFADVSAGPTFTWAQSSLYVTHFANAGSFIKDAKLYVVGGLDIFNSTMDQVSYNTLTLSTTQKTALGTFTGEIFDLGLNRLVDTLKYTITNPGTTAFYYRTAQNQGTWSNWTYLAGSPFVVLSGSLRYVQYMFMLNDPAFTNTTQITSVTLKFSAVQLSGVYLNATWTLANSPYWVTGDVFIDGNVVIEAGASFSFSEGVKMEVRNGTLTSNGTQQLPVLFTSFSGDDGYWNGLHFTANSNNKASVLQYTTIENTGFLGHANINCTSTNQPTFNNGILQNGTNSAVFCNNATPVFNNIVMQNTQNYLVRLQNAGGPVFNSETLLNNSLPKVSVSGGTMGANGYWDNICPEYHILTTININNNLLTIEKGIRILFSAGTGMSSYNGRILAEGANHPDSMIHFGALNGLSGGWTGILLGSTNPSGSKFKHCQFSQGTNYNLRLNGINFQVDSCSFSAATGAGLQFEGSQITVKNSVFQQNQIQGSYSNGNTNYDILFDSCVFSQNGTNGFEGSGSVIVKNSLSTGNGQAGMHFTGSYSGAKFEPQVESVIIQNNGGNGLMASNCFIDIVDVQVLNNAENGFEMNANVSPEYYNFTLTGNLTNDFRILGGSINRDITWEPGMYPFVVTGTFEIRDNSQLSLEKGFTLRFAQNTRINVGISVSGPLGRIYAVGANHPDSVITFTSLNGLPGGWLGITFGSAAGNSLLKHCIIEKAVDNVELNSTGNGVVLDSCVIRNASGKGVDCYQCNFILNNSEIYSNSGVGFEGGGGFKVDGCKIYQNGSHGFEGSGTFDLLNSSVYNNAGSGIRLAYNTASNEPQIENVTVNSNGTNGIWATDCSPDFINVNVTNHTGHGFLMNANTDPEYYNLLLQGNGTNDLRVQGGDVERDITWERGIYPYVVIGTFSTRDNGKLTIEAAMTIRFDQNCGMNIGGGSSLYQGRIQAVGILHPDSMIRFTSLNGEPGGWNGITFGSYARTSELTNCIIENAVNNITFSSSSNYVSLHQCIIRNASNRGIASTNSIFGLKKSAVVNNNGYGIYITGTAVPVIGDTAGIGNDIFNNNLYNIYNQSTNNVFARYNFFNTSDSLTIAQKIYDKSENTSYGTVHFHPYTVTSNFPFGQFISCRARYYNNDSTLMNNVVVSLYNGQSQLIQTSKTNSEGFATFYMLPDDTYLMQGTTTRNWGGGNATDALMILRHFANIIQLTGIRQHVADVNMNQMINATDALGVLQRFTQTISSFPAGDWAFIPATLPLTIAGAPINTTLWSLCFGDVNGSFIPGVAKSGVGEVTLEPSGTMAAAGTEFDIPVYLETPLMPVGAISLNLLYHESAVTIEDIIIPNSPTLPVWSAANGVLNLAWCSMTPLSVSSGNPLFYIRVKVHDISILKTGITFMLTGSNELADALANPLTDPELTYPLVIDLTGIGEGALSDNLRVVANPNPATQFTNLVMAVPASGTIRFEIISTTGAMIYQSEIMNVETGIHSQTLDLSSFRPGVYMVRTTLNTTEGQTDRIFRLSIF